MVYILIRFQFEFFIHSILSWFKERIIRVKDLNTNIEILYIIDIKNTYIYLFKGVSWSRFDFWNLLRFELCKIVILMFDKSIAKNGV